MKVAKSVRRREGERRREGGREGEAEGGREGEGEGGREGYRERRMMGALLLCLPPFFFSFSELNNVITKFCKDKGEVFTKNEWCEKYPFDPSMFEQ